MTILGAIFWSHGAKGCFLWAEPFENGRIYIRADHTFTQKPVEVVAGEILGKTTAMGIYRLGTIYADPEMFPKEHKRAIIEADAPAQTFARCGLPMVASGGNREHGWQRVQDYFRDGLDGRPWLLIDPSCSALIRTLPTLVQKPGHPDDCDGDDFAANALRTLLSARPLPSSVRPAKKAFAWGTVGWLKQLDEPRRGILSR